MDAVKNDMKEALMKRAQDPMNRPKEELPDQELLRRVNNMIQKIEDLQGRTISKDLIKLLKDLHMKVRNCLATGDAGVVSGLEDRIKQAEEAATRMRLPLPADGKDDLPHRPPAVLQGPHERTFWGKMTQGSSAEAQQLKAQQVEAKQVEAQQVEEASK
tara:strand:- start:291 stop:767 length:477 start_codon:yes stop_codon:yes gene_type:complete